MEHDNDRSGGAFASDAWPFHWMTARLWWLRVVARLSHLRPEALAEYSESLTAIALDETWPHVAWRSLAREAVISIGSAIGVVDPTRLAQVEGVNRPIRVRRVRGMRRDDSRRLHDKFRFKFDSMDVLPYWYEPFARIFNTTTRNVAEQADAWISDNFGITGVDVWNDKRELRDPNLHRTRPDHGAFPATEVLATYAELHALMLVAGRMIDFDPGCAAALGWAGRRMAGVAPSAPEYSCHPLAVGTQGPARLSSNSRQGSPLRLARLPSPCSTAGSSDRRGQSRSLGMHPSRPERFIEPSGRVRARLARHRRIPGVGISNSDRPS